MPVGDYCRGDVVTARVEDSVRDAASQMRQRDIGCIVVVDDDEKPIGIVTDRDLVQQVLRRGKDPEATTLADVMNDEVVTVAEHMPLSRALARMRQEAVRRVVIVEHGGRLRGILTQDDILPILSKEIALTAKVVSRQLEPATATART